MDYLKERVSYLQGLAEGMQISDGTNEGKLLKAIIEVMDDIALAVDDIEEAQEQLSEQVDEMDENLSEVESVVFDEDYEEEGKETANSEFDCPHCGEKIIVEGAEFNDGKDKIKCPHCQKDIAIEWECDCDECEDHK